MSCRYNDSKVVVGVYERGTHEYATACTPFPCVTLIFVNGK